MQNTGLIFHEATIGRYKLCKEMAEKALSQVSDEQFFDEIHADGNSLAIIVKHIAGNMLSRWTDFLTSDGEKPGRERDNEFMIKEQDSRSELMTYWESAWAVCLDAIESLTEEQLEAEVFIRKERHSVPDALLRQLAHYSYHIGQIVFLSRWHAGEKWQTLSIPRGGSDEYNRRVM